MLTKFIHHRSVSPRKLIKRVYNLGGVTSTRITITSWVYITQYTYAPWPHCILREFVYWAKSTCSAIDRPPHVQYVNLCATPRVVTRIISLMILDAIVVLGVSTKLSYRFVAFMMSFSINPSLLCKRKSKKTCLVRLSPQLKDKFELDVTKESLILSGQCNWNP